MSHQRSESASYDSQRRSPQRLSHRPRADSLWKVAFSATKGLFSSASDSREAHSDETLPWDGASTSMDVFDFVPPLPHRPLKTLAKSRSTPSLRLDARRQTHHLTPLLPPVPPFASSPRATLLQRRQISLPQRVDPYDPNHTPLIVAPKSDCKSIIRSVFKHKPTPLTVPPAASVALDSIKVSSTTPTGRHHALGSRNRSKSTPVLRLGRRTNKGAAKTKFMISSPMALPYPPTKSIYTIPVTPSLPQPARSRAHVPVCSSPAPSQISASSSTIKRKPVPRFLYSEHPPSHDQSSPPSPPSAETLVSITPLHTPLLSSGELIMNAVSAKGGMKDITLLPIGSGSLSGKHRRSLSAHSRQAHSPWFTAAPAPPSVYDDLRAVPIILPGLSPPPPRVRTHTSHRHLQQVSPPDSPETSRLAALAPLTDGEVLAIRSFLKKHDTGLQARRRRKEYTAGTGYDETAIFESYLNLDLDRTASGAINGSDASSRSSVESSRDSVHSHNNDGMEGELSTPVDANHRGTFGYGGDASVLADVDVFEPPEKDRSFGVTLADFATHITYESAAAVQKAEAGTSDADDESGDSEDEFSSPQSSSDGQDVTFDHAALRGLSGDRGTHDRTQADESQRAQEIKTEEASANMWHPTPSCLIGRPIISHMDLSDGLNGAPPSPHEPGAAHFSASLRRLQFSLSKLDGDGLNVSPKPAHLEPALPIGHPSNTSKPILGCCVVGTARSPRIPHTLRRHATPGSVTPPREETVSSFMHLTPEPSPELHKPRVLALRKFWARATGATAGLRGSS